MVAFQDAFISYGRTDSKAFAIRLKDRLAAAGLTVWFDFDDIPLATDFQERIDNGIERSHAFLYVISPSSVNSPYCDKELALALRYGKRIIPIMHVETIDRTIWQQRNPKGSEEDWQAFQAANKHSSFQNLNETVSKLNWVFFREEDDFEQSLSGLLALFIQHRDYVQRHTQLLLQALAWDRRYRQTRYLLVGDERQAAETWLKTSFSDEGPGCTPTLLHCAFITESIKNSNNLMTQVFLCHAEQDQDVADQIRHALIRQGITVWNYRNDIQSSQDYNSAIVQGVAETDNFLFVLSPHSAQSTYCQNELENAQSLNKRIIPILAVATEPDQVPTSLKSLQYVDLTDNTQASDYQSDERQLLKLLNSEAAYHTEHKIWLAQALKWERQQYNPTMLLRGYNLRRAENWLKVARIHAYPPTELHEKFIAESLNQPPTLSLDIFVSYSRVDSDFARRLNEALQIQGKRTWFDQESIATGTDFEQEIHRGIEKSDVFLFVLSPQSVNSPFCADEVEYAESLNKRVVTVLYRLVDTEDLHPVLAKLQWLDFRDHDGDFQVNFQHLLRTLDTDREHLEVHTRLLGRALEWDRGGRDESLLLRGQNLQTAEHWLVSNSELEPKPTGLQQEYFRAGRALQDAKYAAYRKLRRGALAGTVAAIAGVLIAVGSSWYSKTTIAQANKLLQVARLEQAGILALNQLEFAQIRALLKAIKSGRELETIVAETNPKNKSDYFAASPIFALRKIQTAATHIPSRLLAHKTSLSYSSFSSDGTQVVTASYDHTARIWDLKTGQSTPLKGHEAEVYYASFSPDGTQVVTASEDHTARIWDLNTGESMSLEGHEAAVWHANFSPDGTQVVTASDDGTARIWNTDTGESMLLDGHTKGLYRANFSPDGTQVVTASYDHTARIWNVTTGESMSLEGHEATVWHASFSPDGTQVVTTSADGTARIWNIETGNSRLLEGHEARVHHASFSPDGTQVATASYDHTIRIWNTETGESTLLEGHEESVYHASFSPDGRQLITASRDDTARLWNINTRESTLLEGHGEGVIHASFSSNGRQVLTTSTDSTVRLWDVKTLTSLPFEGHEAEVDQASFSSDGTQVVTASRDGTARIWDIDTGESILLEGHEDMVHHASFSPDGTQVVTASSDNTARIWDTETGESVPLEGHEDSVHHAGFSTDGSRVITASQDGTARVWDTETGESIPLEGHEAEVDQASFSPDGTQVVTASRDGTARIWDTNTGESMLLEGHEDMVHHAGFSPNGTQVVTASRDMTVRIWDTDTGESMLLEGHEAPVFRANFSPDGQQVITASFDDTARIWDVKTGDSTPLEGHKDWVSRANFSSNGENVLTQSYDGTVQIWDLQGRQLAIFEGYPAALSPDGQRVATVQDGRVKIHDIATLPELLDWGCQWLNNYLKYGQATDADRAACNLPPRDDDA